MKVKVLKAVAAVLLLGGATANAQSLDGLSCSGELEVSRTDEAFSVVCSGDLVVSGDWTLPGMALSFVSSGQLVLHAVIQVSGDRPGADAFEERLALGVPGVQPGAGISLGGPLVPLSGRYPLGGDVVVAGNGGMNLSADNNPPSMLTVSSVPEPQTYALWLAGLAAVARIAAARRRNRC